MAPGTRRKEQAMRELQSKACETQDDVFHWPGQLAKACLRFDTDPIGSRIVCSKIRCSMKQVKGPVLTLHSDDLPWSLIFWAAWRIYIQPLYGADESNSPAGALPIVNHARRYPPQASPRSERRRRSNRARSALSVQLQAHKNGWADADGPKTKKPHKSLTLRGFQFWRREGESNSPPKSPNFSG